ncbi:hypothetical protein SAY87_023803 [Trapa incisa]|uniref:Proteasome assembly chaperone 4 n=1 Tax=Trapa incisa TaxID=236973 RepID=A0AAN7KYE4_9MYRT|nr:hypothetical protein SAY87_023803 [Trapa incisa]
MALDGPDVDGLNRALSSAQISGDVEPSADSGRVQITCFSEIVNDVTLQFQIIRLPKQIYAWVGYNSSKLGHLYAAAFTRPNNAVSITSVLGGSSDNTGSGIARRLVLKTGMNIFLACNIPKNSPMIEADAEKILVKKLIDLGYGKPRGDITSQ